ncbi:hypothetical protein MLD38_005789 [Melastoma candidum]|uniref:Uncharacterized protein n=1 Tax=Melastoma candidum TaxID=119954 RepID=A0ACB9RNV2_9MYRT|nr:hypothetical protein MLD38_005789 [Melastoma candidum]
MVRVSLGGHPVDDEVFAVPKDPNSPQQVHITQGDYEGKAVIVSWVTTDDSGPSEVVYGTTQDVYDHSAKGRMMKYMFYKYESHYIHHCILNDLKFDTKYYYKVGSGASSREFWFHTPPEPNANASYKFGVIGEPSVLTRAVLFVGDLSYSGIPGVVLSNKLLLICCGSGEVLQFKQYLQRYPTPYLACKSNSPLCEIKHSGFGSETSLKEWIERRLLHSSYLCMYQ